MMVFPSQLSATSALALFCRSSDILEINSEAAMFILKKCVVFIKIYVRARER